MRENVLEPVRLPDHVWERPETQAALRDRRIAHLFALAKKYAGASQTRIANVIGMDQSEVSRIKNGDRRVTAIDVLERVADGFSMPDHARVLLGLAPRSWTPPAAAPAAAGPAAAGIATGLRGQPGQPSRAVQATLAGLIGRERERATLVDLLATNSLVTLVGPPGIGKTRLALAVAAGYGDRLEDGAVLVELATTTTPEQVLAATADALGATDVPGRPLRDTVAEYLSDRRLLLVLDNFEQVLPAADVVADLLAAAPGLQVLATSRERLHLYGEQVYQVPPLSLPDLDHLPTTAEAIAQARADSAALELFATRAGQATYGFELSAANLRPVAELCHRLDGLPLAIELAAARADQFTPRDLLDQLDRRLDVLSGGPRDLPPRQQTLRGAIGWSFVLLDDTEAELLTQLAVFAGGATLEAAAAVCTDTSGGTGAGNDGADLDRLAGRLATLVDKSLLRTQPDRDGRTRYLMLETIRSYAGEQLDPASGVPDRHAAYFAAFAGRLDEALRGRDPAAWMERAEAEQPNLRAALTWSLAHGRRDLAARIAIGTRRFWDSSNHLAEGRVAFDRVLAATDPLPPDLCAFLLYNAATLAVNQDDYGHARAYAAQALELARTAGEEELTGLTLNMLGIIGGMTGQDEQALADYQAALEILRKVGDRVSIGVALGNLAILCLRLGDFAAARTDAAEALELDREADNVRGVCFDLGLLGRTVLAQGDPATARPLLEESLRLSRTLGDVGSEAAALHHLGRIAAEPPDDAAGTRPVGAGDADGPGAGSTAWWLLGRALQLRHAAGELEDVLGTLELLGLLAAPDAPEQAARILGSAAALRARHGLPRPADGEPTWTEALRRLQPAVPAPAPAPDLDEVVAETLALAQAQAQAQART